MEKTWHGINLLHNSDKFINKTNFPESSTDFSVLKAQKGFFVPFRELAKHFQLKHDHMQTIFNISESLLNSNTTLDYIELTS